MEVLFGLIAISVLVLGIAAAVFLWAVRAGQFDDLTGPAYRILDDDDEQAGPGPRPPGSAAEPEDRTDTPAGCAAPTARRRGSSRPARSKASPARRPTR